MRVITKCLLFHLIFCWLAAYSTVQAAPPSVKARTAVLMDAKTGQVLFNKDMHKRSAPASTTKIMTAIIAIENGRLDDKVKVSARAAGTSGSSMQLYAGQVISLRELVTGLLLRSGNDAAVAIAEHIAGSVENFCQLMNQKAEAIGAVNTHFRNPHGLSAAGHYTTAFDLACMARYALTNPIFAQIVDTKETNIEWLDRSGRERERNLRNTNKLLWMLEEADGVKTGTTGEAGQCLVSSATRDNQKLIAVVLNDPARWYDSLNLLKYGFDNYELFEYANEGDVLAAIPVEDGLAPLVDAVVATPAAMVVPTADYSAVTVELDLPEKIKAPVYQGQKIGEIVFYVHDKAVKTIDINASTEIGERTPATIFFNQLLRIYRQLANWGLL